MTITQDEIDELYIDDPCPSCNGPLSSDQLECVCHISPPCRYCGQMKMQCNTCGWHYDNGVPTDYSHEVLGNALGAV